MYEFDPRKTYRLIDVRDAQGNSKVESHELYRECVGCIAQIIRKQSISYKGEQFSVVKMDFVQDGNGRWIYRRLRTSLVLDVRETDSHLEIRTQNSVYILEPAELVAPVYQDAAELIELYLSDEYDRFIKGFYYDAKKRPHELVSHVHVGMFVDTCLIYLPEDEMGNAIVCRYYIQSDSVEFYDTLYHQQDYSRPILIHNHSQKPMKIKFEGFTAVWLIPPWGEKTIVPYDRMGAESDSANQE